MHKYDKKLLQYAKIFKFKVYSRPPNKNMQMQQ